MIAFTCANETGVKSLLSTPHHIVSEEAYSAEKHPFRYCSCRYERVRKVAMCHRMSRHSRGMDSDSDKSSACRPRYTSALQYVQSISCNSALGS